jgi:hypothetical protein
VRILGLRGRNFENVGGSIDSKEVVFVVRSTSRK